MGTCQGLLMFGMVNLGEYLIGEMLDDYQPYSYHILIYSYMHSKLNGAIVLGNCGDTKNRSILSCFQVQVELKQE